MFNSHEKDDYGTIVDYEIPLKTKQSKRYGNIGKIDLIAKSDNKSITLLELKIGTNKESVLRAILEIYTYYKLVNKARDQFLTEFDAIGYKIHVGIITDKDSVSGKNIQDINLHPKKYPKLKDLIGKMRNEIGGFEFFLYDYSESGKPFCDSVQDEGKRKKIFPQLRGKLIPSSISLF